MKKEYISLEHSIRKVVSEGFVNGPSGDKPQGTPRPFYTTKFSSENPSARVSTAGRRIAAKQDVAEPIKMEYEDGTVPNQGNAATVASWPAAEDGKPKKKLKEEAEGTKERRKIEYVGRPDSAESPKSVNSKLGRQGQYKTKIIDESSLTETVKRVVAAKKRQMEPITVTGAPATKIEKDPKLSRAIDENIIAEDDDWLTTARKKLGPTLQKIGLAKDNIADYKPSTTAEIEKDKKSREQAQKIKSFMDTPSTELNTGQKALQYTMSAPYYAAKSALNVARGKYGSAAADAASVVPGVGRSTKVGGQAASLASRVAVQNIAPSFDKDTEEKPKPAASTPSSGGSATTPSSTTTPAPTAPQKPLIGTSDAVAKPVAQKPIGLNLPYKSVEKESGETKRKK